MECQKMLSTTVKNIINQSVNRWINQNTLGLELGKLDQNTNELQLKKHEYITEWIALSQKKNNHWQLNIYSIKYAPKIQPCTPEKKSE